MAKLSTLAWGWPDGKPVAVEANEERATLVVRVRGARSRSSPLAPDALLEQLLDRRGGRVEARSLTPQPDGSVNVLYEQVPVGWYDLLVTQLDATGHQVTFEAHTTLQLSRLVDRSGKEEPYQLTIELQEQEPGFLFLSPERLRIPHARYRIQSEGKTWELLLR